MNYIVCSKRGISSPSSNMAEDSYASVSISGGNIWKWLNILFSQYSGALIIDAISLFLYALLNSLTSSNSRRSLGKLFQHLAPN